jgi:hypothetical protein
LAETGWLESQALDQLITPSGRSWVESEYGRCLSCRPCGSGYAGAGATTFPPGRTKLMPVSPEDVRTLIELGLIEMRDDVPVLTNEGARALDWS